MRYLYVNTLQGIFRLLESFGLVFEFRGILDECVLAPQEHENLCFHEILGVLMMMSQ